MADEDRDPSGEVNLYTRVPAPVVRRFDVAIAAIGIKRPEGVRRAIDQWLELRESPSGKHLDPQMADPLGRRLKTHPRLLELLADANPEDLWKLEGYLEARRETRKRKGNG